MPLYRQSAPETLRRLVAGDIIGSIERDGTHAWRGIPYAAPPVGPLRWRAPQPHPAWEGARPALQHGPFAPQFAGPLAPVPTHLHGKVVGDEDCLSLNVFAPAFPAGQVPRAGGRRPVMVWIHGGGNSIGTSATYDVARSFAAHEGLVIVTVNYRLGLLGWFRHPALYSGRGITPAERSGNFGTLDLIAALEWVRDNIAAFGGDPGCVTIFGESAGAQNILTLLASPMAKGLFHRAIAQSPLTESFTPHEATDRRDAFFESHRSSGEVVAERLARRLGPDGPVTAAWLRSIPVADLLAVTSPVKGGFYATPRPVRDGKVLPKAPLAEVFRSGRWNRVPVIIGSNRDEYRPFLADKPEHTRMYYGAVPVLRNREAYEIEADVMSSGWRCLHIEAPAQAMLAGGHEAVWSYRFDWDEAPPVPYVRPDVLLGAAHALEIPFIFRDSRGVTDLYRTFTAFNQAGREVLSKAMAQAWASFACDGAPRLEGGQWTARRPDGGPDTLVFDSRADGGIRMETLALDIDGLKTALRQTDRIQRGELRCQIYARAFLWSPILAGHGSLDEYAAWCREFGCHKPAEAFKPQREI